MLFANFLRIIWARKLIFLLALIGTVSSAAAISLWLPKQYAATASLVIDFKLPENYSSPIIPAQLLSSYMATQIDIMSSENVALKVVEMLALEDDQALQDQLLTSSFPLRSLLASVTGGLSDDLLSYLRAILRNSDDPAGGTSRRSALAQELLERLRVTPSKSSGVVEISFRTGEPHLAARAANAFAAAYLETSLQMQVNPALRSVDLHSERISQLRQELEAAKRRLSTFQQTKGFLATEDKLDIENARLAEISSQLVRAQAERSAAESRLQQAEEALDRGLANSTLPEVLGSPLIQRLKAGLVEKESTLAELSQRLDRNHPQYKRAALDVSKLRSMIRAETKSIVESIGKAAELAAKREQEAQEALAAQRARILALKNERNEAEVMLGDVENAQLSYDNAVRRLDDARSLSMANQTNVAILNAATAPDRHASPNLKLNLAVACILGIASGIGLVFVAEIMDRRIRSPGDLEDVLAAPLLGVVIKGGGHRQSGVQEWFGALRNSVSAAGDRLLESRRLGDSGN